VAGVIAVQTAVVCAVAPTAPVLLSDAMHNHALPGRVFATHHGLAPDAMAALTDPGNVGYPPLVAFNDALLFLADEDLGAFAVPLFGAFGFLAWALLVREALGRPGVPLHAAAVTILVLATPEAVANSIDGFVDVRFAATLLWLALDARRVGGFGRRGLAPVVAAAVAAGLSKAEGQVAAAVVCGWLLLGRRWHGLALGVTALPVVAVAVAVAAWPWLAHGWGLPSEIEIVERSPSLSSIAAGVMHATSGLLAAALDVDAAGIPRWGVLWPAAGAVAAWQVARRRDRTSLSLLLLMLGHLGAYGLVLAVLAALTTVDLEWTLPATQNRLLLHLLPWVVLLLGRALASPAGADGRPRPACGDWGSP
jgi:hypothetical protein